MSTLHGIDVSHWQAGLDLGRTDAEFVIIKATEGTGTVDSECDRFYQRAKALGLLRGVYHFYRGGGAREADHFIDSTRAYHGDALLVLDFETNVTDTAGALAFLDRVKARTGVTPGIYTNPNVIGQHRSGITNIAQAGYWLWLARWGSSPGDISPWSTLTLWQYTDAHKTGGYAVDADRFYGTAGTWHALAGTTDTDTDDKDDDMPLTHFNRGRSTDQPLNGTDWHTLKVAEDGEGHTAQVVGVSPKGPPIDVVSATVNVAATGLGDSGHLDVRLIAVDDGKTDKVVNEGTVDRLQAPGGSAHASVPFTWRLSKPAAGADARRLRVQVKPSKTGAKITGVRVEGFTTPR